MPIREYAVLDVDGYVINTISVDEESVASGKYYPGYGARLAPVGVAPQTKPVDFGVLDVVVDLTNGPLQSGDRVDFRTGQVTRKVPIIIGGIEP